MLCNLVVLIDVNSSCLLLLLVFPFSFMMYYDRSFISCTHAVTGFLLRLLGGHPGRGKYLRFIVVIMV